MARAIYETLAAGWQTVTYQTTETPGVEHLQMPRKIPVCDCDTH